MCLHNSIIKKIANINIPNTFPTSKFTRHKAFILRLKDEIEYLCKEEELNEQLLHLLLLLACYLLFFNLLSLLVM